MSDVEFLDAEEQCFTEFLVNILVEHPVDDGLFHQQRLIHREDLLLGLLVIHLGPLEQILEIHDKRLYVLSNAQRMFTEYEMRLLQIYDRFDGIVFSSDEGCMKPDPAFYQVVLDRFQLDKRASIMIGNDAVADILGANHAGLDSLYLHSDLSPEIEGELQSTFSVLDGDVRKIKELIVR